MSMSQDTRRKFSNGGERSVPEGRCYRDRQCGRSSGSPARGRLSDLHGSPGPRLNSSSVICCFSPTDASSSCGNSADLEAMAESGKNCGDDRDQGVPPVT